MNRVERILATIGEEGGEVSQIAGKCLRFGLDSYHPDDPTKTTNLDRLEREVIDVLTMYEMLMEELGEPEMDLSKSIKWAQAAEEKYEKWEHFDAMFRHNHKEQS